MENSGSKTEEDHERSSKGAGHGDRMVTWNLGGDRIPPAESLSSSGTPKYCA